MKQNLKEANAKIKKLSFPDWHEIMYSLIKGYSNELEQDHIEYSKTFLEKAEKIKNIGFGNHIALTMQIAIDSNAFNQEESEFINPDDFKKNITEINEFYSVFELNKGEFIEVDTKIEDILGISPNNFTIAKLFAADLHNPLFHPEDVSHVIRWAGIAYAVLGFPGIKILPLRDYYKISFRLNTESSSLKQIQRKKFVTLEKKCFLQLDEINTNFKFPRYHFDKWNVFPSENFEFVKPYFVSTEQQSAILNKLSYLMNAYLLDISPKYLLMLDSRREFDRNKEIANEINTNIKEFGQIEFQFSENQIADYFSKTIRNKIGFMAEKWDKIMKYGSIQSEQQAITIAQKFGLIPIPHDIKEWIYMNLSYE